VNKELKQFIKDLSPKQITKLTKMIWEDSVSYKEIKKVFSLSPNQVETVARSIMAEKDFKRWRLRQQKRSTKKGREPV
jgi:uncharacterized protein (TIGR03643 family)